MAILLAVLTCSSFAADCIAHRGFTSHSKENSLESIQEAWKFQADTVEVDIHVLKDGELILFHDDQVAGKTVKSLGYDEIQSLVGTYRVPTLQQALRNVPLGKSIVLDLKANSIELGEALSNFFKREVYDFKVIIQCPDLPFLSSLKPRLPESFEYHFLTKLERSGPFWKEPSTNDLIAEVKKLGIGGLSIKGCQLIDQKLVESIQNSGIRLYVWTINDPERIRHYAKLGVNGIITDCVEAKKHINDEKAKSRLKPTH